MTQHYEVRSARGVCVFETTDLALARRVLARKLADVDSLKLVEVTTTVRELPAETGVVCQMQRKVK